MTESVKYLTEDSITPSMQKFVCISFLLDSNIKDDADDTDDIVKVPRENKNNLVGIKIRGVFEKYDDACDHAKKLQSIDPNFNIYVGEVGKWLPFNPDVNVIQTSEYLNEGLNDMMKSYHENQDKANLLHEKRKNEMLLSTIKDNITNRKTNLEELQKELNLTDCNENTDSKILSVEEQIKELNTNETDLEKKISDLTDKIKQYTTSNNEKINNPVM